MTSDTITSWTCRYCGSYIYYGETHNCTAIMGHFEKIPPVEPTECYRCILCDDRIAQLEADLEQARRWAAAWKLAAKENRILALIWQDAAEDWRAEATK